MNHGAMPSHGIRSFSEWKQSNEYPSPEQFLATLRMHYRTRTDFNFGDASDQLGEPGLVLDLDTRAAVVSCCLGIMKAGVERGSSRCDALFLASKVLHEPDDDLTIDAQLLAKLNIEELRAGVQAVVSEASAQVFNPRLERVVRDSWNFLGQQATDLAQDLSAGDLSQLRTPK